MPDEPKISDVKPQDSPPSTESTAKVASAVTLDAPAKTTDVKDPTMADIVATVAAKHSIEMETPSVPKPKAESEIQLLNQTEEEKAKIDGEKDDLAVKGEDKTEKTEETKPLDPVPYERFKEVNEKARDFEQKYLSAEPVLQAHNQIVDFCKTEGIDSAQFQDGLRMLALINKSPQEAVKALSTLIEQIQGYTGDKLPEDLQNDVSAAKTELDNGEISQARYDAYVARAKELAQLRAQSRLGQQRQQKEQQTAQQRQEQERLHALTTTAKSWEETKLKSDPDFKQDGEKYSLVYDRFFSLSNKRDAQGRYLNPLQSPDDVHKLLGQAYDQIHAVFSKNVKGQKKANGQKILTSTGSSVTAELEPKSMRDIARIVGAKHGISI